MEKVFCLSLKAFLCLFIDAVERFDTLSLQKGELIFFNAFLQYILSKLL